MGRRTSRGGWVGRAEEGVAAGTPPVSDAMYYLLPIIGRDYAIVPAATAAGAAIVTPTAGPATAAAVAGSRPVSESGLP